MIDVLIIAHFTQAPGEFSNDRFHYIADKISIESATIEMVTTSFSHGTKKQRNLTDEQLNCVNYKFTMLHEPGYQKNISLKRFYSHYVMGRNLKKYLEARREPNVIYCAVPSLDVAKVAAKYAKKKNIRLIIDIQDLWPEAFKMVFNVPVLSNLIFYPMKRQADYVYSVADNIIAVSETYANRALKVNRKCQEANIVFLGTELAYFDRLAKEHKLIDKPKDEIWLAYIGTLGHSYDLICVLDALKILQNQGVRNVKFVVMGDGPLKTKFEKYAKEQDIYSVFMGRLDYGKMVGILTACNIAVNPITHGASGSIINKHADYAAAGLPVINTQESQEYRDLIDLYMMGFNCENNNPTDLADKLMKLCQDENFRKTMAYNSRRLAEDRFDRKKTYQKIFELLEIT